MMRLLMSQYAAAAVLLLLLLWVPVDAFTAVKQTHHHRHQYQYYTTTSSSSSKTTSLSATTKKEVDCLVIGSGVSGSSLAFNLHKHHDLDVLMVERNDVVGGNLISKSNNDGFVWDEGPNSFQPTPSICRIIHELGLTADLVLADASKPRFVYWEGEGAGSKLANLHALPTNLPGDLLDFNLLTWPGKIRAGLGAIGVIAPPPDKEESIREFVTRHLGAETFERVIDPFVSGVYAGDPDALSMRAALKKIYRLEGLGNLGPGLVSGALERFAEIAQEKKDNPPDPAWPTYEGGQLGSFRKGLQTLSLKIETQIGPDRVWKSTVVDKIEKTDDGRYRVTMTSNASEQKVVLAKSVCLTSPTRVTCKLASDLIPAAARLSEVYSPPVASVTMAYKKEWFKKLPNGTPDNPVNGFGHLLPRKMGVRSLGTIWCSSLFPGRAPEGWELLLTYIGGARDPGILDLSEDEIFKQVDADNHQILLKPDAPAGQQIACRVWKVAIPQYRKGHLEILDEVSKDEAKCAGFFLGGNYRTGVAFGDCIQFGWDEANKVASYLAESSDASSSSSSSTKTEAGREKALA